jgi:hypothetical protein
MKGLQMRMRDELATVAMGALIQAYANLSTTEGYSADECAQDAYLYADMMIHERKQKRKRIYRDDPLNHKLGTDKERERERRARRPAMGT